MRTRALSVTSSGTSFAAPQGIIAPILTPFNDDLSIATDLFVELAHSLLRQGCAALAPFGTTGEALSVGIDERIEALQALVAGGVEPSLLIPGTGLSNLADTARLSNACLGMGCNAVLTLPPFYYKTVSDDGIYRYFAELVAKVGENARIVLYHIPPVAVVGVSTALAARLHADFPQTIVAIKDSSGDWNNTRALLDIDGLIVYPGSEMTLLKALQQGGPGCITATANVNAAAMVNVVRLYAGGDAEAATAAHEDVCRVRLTIQDYGPIPAQKRLLALQTADDRWGNVRPPLEPLDEAKGRELARALGF